MESGITLDLKLLWQSFYQQSKLLMNRAWIKWAKWWGRKTREKVDHSLSFVPSWLLCLWGRLLDSLLPLGLWSPLPGLLRVCLISSISLPSKALNLYLSLTTLKLLRYVTRPNFPSYEKKREHIFIVPGILTWYWLYIRLRFHSLTLTLRVQQLCFSLLKSLPTLYWYQINFHKILISLC